MTIRPPPPRSATVAEMLMQRIPFGAAYKQLTLSCVRKKITQLFVRWPFGDAHESPVVREPKVVCEVNRTST